MTQFVEKSESHKVLGPESVTEKDVESGVSGSAPPPQAYHFSLHSEVKRLKMKHRAGAAQAGTCSLQKCEDLSSIPGTHVEQLGLQTNTLRSQAWHGDQGVEIEGSLGFVGQTNWGGAQTNERSG